MGRGIGNNQSLLDPSFHKYGNKSGKLLALMCKGSHTSTHTAALKNKFGNFITFPKQINRILEKYYASLYGQDPIDEHKATSFLENILLPTIDDSLLAQLNAPIALDEIAHTIKSLSPGKVPGPNG